MREAKCKNGALYTRNSSCLKIYSKASAQGCDNSKNSKIKLKKRQNKKEENRPTKYREIFDSFCESPLFG